MGDDLEVKSSRNLVAGTEGKRKAFVVRRTLNEA